MDDVDKLEEIKENKEKPDFVKVLNKRDLDRFELDVLMNDEDLKES